MLVGLAHAQGDVPATPPPLHADVQEPVAAAADGHERRAALRAALLAQRESVAHQEVAREKERQLNEKERAELRQQLRQQRRPSP